MPDTMFLKINLLFKNCTMPHWPKPYCHRYCKIWFSSGQNDSGALPLVETQCSISNSIDCSPIWVSVWVVSWVATRLFKPFRDMWPNWSGVIKSKPSDITEFHKLPQVYLAKDHATTLHTNAWHSVLENRPPLQKLHYDSLTKTIVPKILQDMVFWWKKWQLSAPPPSWNSMLWIQCN